MNGSDMDESTSLSFRVLELRLKHAPWRLTSWLQPHEYLAGSEDPESNWILEAMQQQLTEQGYWDQYDGFRNQYLEIDGFRYWVIGKTLNRERLPISNAWPGSNPD
jgi:hypothetical protein